jgi:hypothetical protein
MLKRYRVRVVKSETVLLGQDVEVEADSEETARSMVQEMIDEGEIDDDEYSESDSGGNDDDEITLIEEIEDDDES